MLTRKTYVPYWEDFAQYQSFSTLDEMTFAVKRFVAEYDLTDTMISVLNTIKLHAKTYIGVCWLYREEISKKAKVSLSSVDRAVSALKEVGLLTVINKIHTKRGGKTHNLYIINNLVDSIADLEEVKPSVEASFESSSEASNDASVELVEEPVKPCPARDSAVADLPYKNFDTNFNTDSHKNPNKQIKPKSINIDSGFNQLDFEIMTKRIPAEFVEILRPYYAENPQVILDRWKSVCVAFKKTTDVSYKHWVQWQTVATTWKVVVNHFKRNLIDRAKFAQNDDEVNEAIGAYFFKALLKPLEIDYLWSDVYMQQLSSNTKEKQPA